MTDKPRPVDGFEMMERLINYHHRFRDADSNELIAFIGNNNFVLISLESLNKKLRNDKKQGGE